MLKNSLKFAWRSIVKYKTYSLLNVTGLAIAITSSYLLFLYASDELSFDRFHQNHKRIFRITSALKNNSLETAMSGQPWGPNLVADHPEFEAYSRSSFYNNNVPIEKDDEIVFENNLLFVDSTFFEVFDFKLLTGSTQSVLDEPTDVVLSQSMALKYFGEEEPLGKTIRVNFNGTFTSYQVSGIVEDAPANSHLQYQMLFTKQSDFQLFPQIGPNNWTRHNGFTYVRLSPSTSEQAAEALLPGFFEKHAGEAFNERYVPSLQPITDIHLHSDLFGEIAPNSNANYVKVASYLSLFILLIGCINYINLNTALSVKRAKEVGARKVIGAYRSQLTFQFLTESVLVALCSMTLAVVLVHLSLPFLNDLSGKALNLTPLEDGFRLLLLAVGVGVMAGIYPALILSRFKPSEVLKGKFQNSGRGLVLRRGLIVFQFTLSLVLLVGTAIIFDQSEYIKDKELGFASQGVMILGGITTEQINDNLELLRNRLTQNPEIHAISAASSYPSQLGMASRFKPQGFTGTNEDLPTLHTIYTDFDLIDVLDFQLIEGRNFDKRIASDSSAFILNESAASLFGWDEPIGKSIETFQPGSATSNKIGRVIGLVKDFHFESLHKDIKPVVIHIDPTRHYNILVRYETNASSKVMGLLEKEWQTYFPEQALNHSLMKDNFDQLHESDFQLQQIITAGSLLAIIIASIGLFGLATFLAQQKVKEIGIRKVLGASQLRLLLLLNREFSIPIFFAIIIGTPVAYYLMDQWLNNFAYRTSFNFWLLPVAAALVLLIAFVTVSYKSLEASKANPVKALRNDG